MNLPRTQVSKQKVVQKIIKRWVVDVYAAFSRKKGPNIVRWSKIMHMTWCFCSKSYTYNTYIVFVPKITCRHTVAGTLAIMKKLFSLNLARIWSSKSNKKFAALGGVGLEVEAMLLSRDVHWTWTLTGPAHPLAPTALRADQWHLHMPN